MRIRVEEKKREPKLADIRKLKLCDVVLDPHDRPWVVVREYDEVEEDVGICCLWGEQPPTTMDANDLSGLVECDDKREPIYENTNDGWMSIRKAYDRWESAGCPADWRWQHKDHHCSGVVICLHGSLVWDGGMRATSHGPVRRIEPVRVEDGIVVCEVVE